MNLQGILQALNVNSSPGIAGWVLYIMLILALVTLFMQKNPNNMITILLAVVIMCTLIDKVNRGEIFSTAGFGTYIIRILMFVCPAIVAGMTRSEKSRPPAILGSLIAAVYLFARWFFEMRPV